MAHDVMVLVVAVRAKHHEVSMGVTVDVMGVQRPPVRLPAGFTLPDLCYEELTNMGFPVLPVDTKPPLFTDPPTKLLGQLFWLERLPTHRAGLGFVAVGDRRRTRDTVFALPLPHEFALALDAAARRWLNGRLHP